MGSRTSVFCGDSVAGFCCCSEADCVRTQRIKTIRAHCRIKYLLLNLLKSDERQEMFEEKGVILRHWQIMGPFFLQPGARLKLRLPLGFRMILITMSLLRTLKQASPSQQSEISVIFWRTRFNHK